MQDKNYLTITHIDDYAGSDAIRPGMKLKLKKDHHNPYDDEAILVCMDHNIRVGYAANSTCTVCRGTHSAGYLQHLFEEEAGCTVCFVGVDFAIAELDNSPNQTDCDNVKEIR